MKRVINFILIISMIFSLNAEGWRKGEKEVKVFIKSQSEAQKLSHMRLNGDIYPTGYALMYLVDRELESIENAGLEYTVLKEDLNDYYKDFWSNNSKVPNGYYEWSEVVALADSLADNFPDICEKHIFGYTAGGQELAALKISDNVSLDENEAEVMFDGGIHGDEIGATENTIRFARDLCQGYGTKDTITELIDSREIWLYYCVNPYGRENMARTNANGVDLNRDWGYMWDGWGGSTGAYSQNESKALRSLMYNKSFVVHTTYHSGIEYISLPWSYRSEQCPDYSQIYNLGGVYAETSLYPNMEYGQGNTGMYAINGSTKDTNYGMMGAISWSMEISQSKQPPSTQLQMYYERNVPAMLAMIEYAGYGVEGIVTDAVTGDPVKGIVFVNDYMPCYTDQVAGDYHKYVLPGTYSITIMANGYETKTIDNIVVTENSSTATDFSLDPLAGQFVYKFSASQIPGNNTGDEGNTPAVFGAPDNVNYSIGKNGWVVLDMQDIITDGPGNDVVVYEGDSSPEGYTCYASESMDGPWLNLGQGMGTTEFDFSNASLAEAQFIKITDDGDGSQNAADAGFDLDAIGALEHVSGVYIGLISYTIDDSAQGNNDGRFDPGETVDVSVTLKNNGDITAENTIGNISTAATYITLDSAAGDFGTLASGESATAVYTMTSDINTPMGYGVVVELDVSCNSGTYTNSFNLDFVVGNPNLYEFTFDEDIQDWTVGGQANSLFSWSVFPQYSTTTKCIWIDSDAAGSGAGLCEDWAITPVLALENYTAMKLQYDYAYRELGCDFEILYRVNGGNWVQLTALTANDSWGSGELDLPQEAFTNSTEIAFHYTDNAGWAWYAAFDNVILVIEGVNPNNPWENIIISPLTFNVEVEENGDPVTSQIDIENSSDEDLEYTITVNEISKTVVDYNYLLSLTAEEKMAYDAKLKSLDKEDWLTVTPMSGTVLSGESNNVDLTFDAAGFEIGTEKTAELTFFNGDAPYPSTVDITMTVIEDSDINSGLIPAKAFLSQNYPNPFNPETTINFANIKDGIVSLNIYNTKGEIVSTLINSELISGYHSVKYNAAMMTSGVYYYTLTTPTETITKKMMLVK